MPIVKQNATFGNPSHGACTHLELDIAFNPDQVIDRRTVIDPLDGLFDDWSFIEIGGHELRGSPDLLHPALVGAVIRSGILEPG